MNQRKPLDEGPLIASCSHRTYIGRRIEIVAETHSTNDDCHARSEMEDVDGLVILAEHQSSGRGQHGRQWSAPPRSAILMSLSLRPPDFLDQPAFLTAWSALSVASLLEERFHLPARIKWPNDVLVEGRKICGILVERRRATVVGIGLNVSIRAHEFPPNLRAPATSLEVAAGAPVDRTSLAVELLDRMETLFAEARVIGPASLYDAWEKFSLVQPGDQVRASTSTGDWTGTLQRLRPDSGVRIATSAQNSHSIPSERLLRVEEL